MFLVSVIKFTHYTVGQLVTDWGPGQAGRRGGGRRWWGGGPSPGSGRGKKGKLVGGYSLRLLLGWNNSLRFSLGGFGDRGAAPEILSKKIFLK